MHPLPKGAPQWTQGYRAIDLSEQRVIEYALEHLGDYAELWYRLLDLYVQGLRGVAVVDDERAQLSWEARSQLLGLALGNSKAALDMVLSGYYSACYSLIRHLLETWEHVAYIRVEPASAKAWYEQEDERSQWQFEPKDTTRRKRLGREKTTKGVLKNVVDFTTKMHKGAHPTGEGLVQTMAEGAGRYVLGSTYRRSMALLALDAGIFANLLLLSELAQLKPQNENWWKQLYEIEGRRPEMHKIYPPSQD